MIFPHCALSRLWPSLGFAALLTVTGCGAGFTPSAPTSVTQHSEGSVHAGELPVAGATIQLYTVNTTARGGTSTALIGSSVLTDSEGRFSIQGEYSCSEGLVYVTATGGNPGAAGTNHNLALMTALGNCASLSASSAIAVNELTTVAAVQALAVYMHSATAVGAGATNLPALTDAFAQSSQFVNPATGTSPGVNVPTGLSVPVSLIDSLADILAPCVHSTGGVSGDSTACGQLFQLATPSGGSAPTDTIMALLDITRNPAENRAPLFELIQSNAPYQPVLSSVPVSLTVTTALPMPERNNLLGEYLVNEGSGTVADDTSGNGNTGIIVGSPGWDGSADLNFTATDGQYISLPTAVNALQTWQILFYNPPFSSSVTSVGAAPVYQAPPGAESLLCGSNTSVPCFANNGYLTAQSSNFYAFNTDHTEAAPYLNAGWHVVTYICGSSQSAAHILYDGVEVGSYLTQGASTCPVATSGNYQLGGSSIYGKSETTFVGRMAGAWAWSTALTVSEAQTAGQTALSFLQAKGIPLNYPSLNPTTPLILTGLDSRTAGAGEGNSSTKIWPFEMKLTDPSYKVINLANGGETVFDTVNEFSVLYKLQFVPQTVPVIIMLWGGVNDANFQSAQQIADNLHSLVLQSKALGARVILATDISATNKDANKNALNTILRAQAFGWGADNLADLATDPVLGADGASTDTTYFADGLHPNSTAETHVTAVMQDAVNELLGSTASAPTQVSTSTYEEVSGDDYLLLTGNLAQSIALPDCTGYTLPRQITAGSLPATVTTISGQTLSGSPVLTANTTAHFLTVPGSMASSGCSWQRTDSTTAIATNAGVTVASSNLALGDSTTLTAHVTAAGQDPSGSVTFLDTFNSSTTTLGTVTLSGGSASLPYNAATAGRHQITTIYTPASNSVYAGSADTTGKSILVAQAPAVQGNLYDSTQIGNPLSVQEGSSIALTILFAFPGTIAPTGAVTVSANGSSAGFTTPVCVYKSKHANCSLLYTVSMTPGSYPVSFSVSPDANYNLISGSASITITP